MRMEQVLEIAGIEISDVLILVLMECGWNEYSIGCITNPTCLNPCSNGMRMEPINNNLKIKKL